MFLTPFIMSIVVLEIVYQQLKKVLRMVLYFM